jgi:hypothetical protein
VSQSFNEVLATLEKGDVFKLTATLRVKSRDEVGVITEEVRSGGLWAISPEDGETSATLQVVSKAAPRRQSFKVGDVISGATLREVRWLRGTFIRCVGIKNPHGFVLHGDGRWHSIGIDGVSYDFKDFSFEYEILYLPQ